MRRLAGVLAAVMILAGGCSSDKKDDGAAPTTASSTPTTSAGTASTGTTQAAVSCNGIGPAPKGSAFEVTYVQGGKLWAKAGPAATGEARCLIDGVGGEDGVAWGGGADRVLAGNKVVLPDGMVDEPFPAGGRTVLSRPLGKSVIDIRSGRLNKRELGKSPTEITFLSGHSDTVYHPAGTHIVSVGEVEGRSILQIANNVGQGGQDLVENETARRIYAPAFTASGALLFIADHGSYTELHRLEIDSSNFTTVEKENMPNGMDHLVTSPFDGGGVAWAQGACDAAKGGRRLRVQRGGQYQKTEGTAVERGQPIGWTPDASLLVMTPGPCEGAAGDGGGAGAGGEKVLHLFKDGKATEVARGVSAAAVRATLPPPPAPPKKIPQQAPA